MITDNILHKYLRHLNAVTDNGPYPHMDAVELAFRLAIEEIEESMAPADTVAQLGTANLRIMELQADLERLQTATDAEVADLRQHLAQLDADNAAMIRRNKELTDELHIARNGTGLAIKNPPFANGPADANLQSPISDLQSSMWDDPTSLTLLDDEAQDWWIGCAAGRHAWRTVPKPVRWRLVRSVLRSIWTDGKLPTMDDFDKHAPAWMPTANACATTFGDGKWTVMCEKAIEP